MDDPIIEELRRHDIQPSVHRVAIARFVLHTDEHPTADQVWQKVKKELPVVSRATVYNTLNLFAGKGLLTQLYLADGVVVFDPKVDKHHHFIDESTGRIHDVPWGDVQVCHVEDLDQFEVRDYQVVMRGTHRTRH